MNSEHREAYKFCSLSKSQKKIANSWKRKNKRNKKTKSIKIGSTYENDFKVRLLVFRQLNFWLNRK